MARAPSDGRGVPLAMWIRPTAPSSSAVQPIEARIVSVLRSGWRRNRQASSSPSTGSTQASEPNPPTATVRMDRPAALGIRNHRPAASTMAAPRVSSPTPSRLWCGSRSRAPRPMARAANPTAPATPSQAAAIIRPVHVTRITTGSRGLRAGGRRPFVARRPADRPWALPVGFRLLFFFGAERVWLPCPAYGPATCLGRAASRRLGAASSSPPLGRAEPLRARVAILQT